MATHFYELLGVNRDASPDEIKRAFRREIAKYHPDKVQHLGKEFQEIAELRSAELTRAYKTLADGNAKSEYDEDVEPAGALPPRSRPTARTRETPSVGPSERSFRAVETQHPAAASDLVRRAILARFRQAVHQEFGRCEEAAVDGFEIACAPPKGHFWSEMPPRILVRFVPRVDAAAIAESWGLAARMQSGVEPREVCVFVIGPLVAPVAELARAIAESMRKPSRGGVILVPFNTRTWSANTPAHAPPAVKTLIAKLKAL